jgi:hypothetical protein
VPDRAALLIAVETFFEVGPPVPYAAADAAELMRALPDAGYNLAKCVLLAGTRTTKAVIDSHLKRLPMLIGKADSLLVLIVSRGFTFKHGGYLACADTILSDPAGTALSVSDLVESLRKAKFPATTLLIDADPLPVAEGAKDGVSPGLVSRELEHFLNIEYPFAGLLAAEPDERSYESAQLRHGIWRHHLIEAFTGKTRSGVGKDGTLSAQALHDFLADSVPRTLRRTYETALDQTPILLGEGFGEYVVADLSKHFGTGGELLDPSRLKRVVFRADQPGRVKDLSGFRKSHTVPDRANEWARKYVARTAAPDIKLDLDNVFDAVREQFGYKRKDVDVSAERDGFGFIRTPDFEYTVGVSVNPDEPSDVIWRREIGRLSDPAFVRSEGYVAIFGPMFDKLVFEFTSPVNVAEFVDRIEDAPPEGVKVSIASDANAAEIKLAGFAGKVTVTPQAVEIEGRTGSSAGLLDQFLAFLRKFSGIGEPKALPPASGT